MVKEQQPQQSKNVLPVSPQQPTSFLTSSQSSSCLSLRDSSSINITNGKLDSIQQDILLEQSQLAAEDIKLYGNHLPNIIQMITSISLSYLKSLYLSGNRIASIENIQLLNSPALQVLSLKNNFIISLRSLRKMNLSNLQQLWLNNNFILDYSPLSQMRTANQGIMLGLDTANTQAVNHQVKGLLRMQFKTLKHLYTSKKFTIVDSKLDKVLAQRFFKKN